VQDRYDLSETATMQINTNLEQASAEYPTGGGRSDSERRPPPGGHNSPKAAMSPGMHGVTMVGVLAANGSQAGFARWSCQTACMPGAGMKECGLACGCRHGQHAAFKLRARVCITNIQLPRSKQKINTCKTGDKVEPGKERHSPIVSFKLHSTVGVISRPCLPSRVDVCGRIKSRLRPRMAA
jgi:hypothetical protein